MKPLKLGFLTVHGDTENHSQMMNGVFEAAKNNNVNIIRFATKIFDEDLDKYNAELNNLYKIIKAQKLDGLMFLGWMSGLVGKYFDDFLKRFDTIPIVSLGTKYENIPNVYANPKECITELLEHMITVHGYKRIVFVPPRIADIRDVIYTEVMRKYGLYQNELIITNEELSEVPFDSRMKRVLSILIDERKVKFDAILVMYDTDAQHLIKELKLREIKIPDDLGIASYENTVFSNYSIPPLTTITYPWREVGFQGCEKIIKLLNQKPIMHSTAIPSKLIIRNSCGCSSNSIKLSKIEARVKINDTDEKLHYEHILSFSDKITKAFPNVQIKINKLMYELIKDFEEATTTKFLTEFEHQLQDIVNRCPYLDTIDEIELLIYYMRNLIISYIANESQVLILFEDIILKVQVLIKEKAITVIGFGQLQIKKIDQELHYVSQNLIDTFNVQGLLNVLENNLALLEVPSCYIFQFNKDSLEECRLIFKYVNYKRVSINNVPASSLYISDEIIKKHKKILCQLLYVHDEYLGFILFEPLLIDERIYHTLSLHISSALKGAILLEDLKDEIALRREKEKQLMYIANYDSLTGLFNRRYFYQTTNYIIEKSALNLSEKATFFLLYIDVDGFKQVNDSLGHDIGDRLLIEIAHRIKASLQVNLYLIPEVVQSSSGKSMKEAIFRLGGDEFTAIVSEIEIKEMVELAKKAIELMKSPYYIGEHIISISCSLGISTFPDDADSTEMIIKYADMAMYHAKKKKGIYSFFKELTH